MILQARQVHRQRRNFATGESDRYQPSVPAHEARKRRNQRAAYVFDADIEALATCRGFHLLANVLA
jgi:hypothetical protein